jgi:hypothetical protein
MRRRRMFAFAKVVDIETIVTSAVPAALPELEKLAAEFGINVGFESSNPKTLMSSLAQNQLGWLGRRSGESSSSRGSPQVRSGMGAPSLGATSFIPPVAFLAYLMACLAPAL